MARKPKPLPHPPRRLRGVSQRASNGERLAQISESDFPALSKRFDRELIGASMGLASQNNPDCAGRPVPRPTLHDTESTVARYMTRRRSPPGVGRHSCATMPLGLRLLICSWFAPSPSSCSMAWFILSHARRRLMSISVTNSPTAERIAGQMTDAFLWDVAPHHLIRDRDGAFGSGVHPLHSCQRGSEITLPHHARRGRRATLSGSSDRYVANLSTTSSCSAKRTCAVS
jgi:hypothetical protein